MSIYKLTCETGAVYFGSTKMSLEERKSKGWYKCSCKDFINPKMELLETVEDLSLLEIVEDKYISTYECVNKNRARVSKEQRKKMEKEWHKKNKERIGILLKKQRERVIAEKRHYCSLCDIAFQSPKKLERHINGYRHKLKNESYLIYGEDWKEHYLQDNRQKYEETRRNKKITPPN